MRIRRALAGAAAFSVVLAACAQKPAPPPKPPAPVAVRPRPVPLPDPGEYVARAASIDLFVVRASQVALQRSRDPRTRELAERMLADHRGLAAQLSLAGRRLNLLPGAALLPEQARWLASVEGSASLDGEYYRQLLQAHSDAIALHGTFARRGISPTLRPVAANAERVELDHFKVFVGR